LQDDPNWSQSREKCLLDQHSAEALVSQRKTLAWMSVPQNHKPTTPNAHVVVGRIVSKSQVIFFAHNDHRVCPHPYYAYVVIDDGTEQVLFDTPRMLNASHLTLFHYDMFVYDQDLWTLHTQSD